MFVLLQTTVCISTSRSLFLCKDKNNHWNL